MKAPNKRDVAELIRDLEGQGFTVKLGKSGHHKIYRQDGRLVTTLPQSPSDPRGLLNTLSILRRNGYTPPIPGQRRSQPRVEAARG